VGLTYGGALDGDADEAGWRDLEEHVGWLFPSLKGVRITHRWGGPFSVTMDLTPALGYLGGKDAVYTLGCIGHGVSMSHLNAQTIVSTGSTQVATWCWSTRAISLRAPSSTAG
jgi:glycine/D-amino acid oxidase-like deaminating enzyme